jgi:hypothetical protein
MIKLHASYGLKVPGKVEFSSESFHATAEIELADNLVNQPEALKAALHSLWSDLKDAVAAEIQGNAGNGQHGQSSGRNNGQNGRRHEPVNRVYGNGSNGNSGGNGRDNPPASKKQIGFLLSLARRKRNFSAEQARQWLHTERRLDLNALSKQQATQLIDELNAN